jgi:hypothetical protein
MLGNIHQNNQKRSCLFMHFYNVGFLGSLGAFVLLAVNAGQAQSSGSMPLEHTQSSSSVPATVAGGFAQFSPNSKIDSLGKAADGAITHTTATFPVPAIAGHPGVAVRAISPGIFPQGSRFLPIDPQSKPALTGDFALLGGVTVSYPQEGLHLAFTQFREDNAGNLFARFSGNGQDIGGGEIELATATASRIAPTPDKTQFTIAAKLRISNAFAQLVNGLFGATVLTTGDQIATEDLVADVGN